MASSSSASTPVAYRVLLRNVASAHPTLRFSLPASFLDAPKTSSHTCRPALLIRLPPGLFIDPFTFPIAAHAPASDESASVVETTKDDGAAEQAPTYAVAQGRDVISSLRILNGTEATADALDHDFSRVELEKGMGYSLTRAECREMGGSANSASTQHNADRLVREYTAALVELFRVRLPEIVAEGAIPNAPESSLSVEPKSQQLDIDIPLHTRYPLPVGNPTSPLDWAAIGDNLLRPARGSYHTALLEYPHAFWSCDGEGLLAVDSGIYEPATPSELLAPMHDHLAIPSAFASSSSNQQLYRLTPPFGTSREPFRVRIPVGDAAFGFATQVVTFVSLILAALFIVRQTSAAVKRTQGA